MASICFNVVSASGLLVAQRISIKQLLNHLQGTSVSQAIQDLSVVQTSALLLSTTNAGGKSTKWMFESREGKVRILKYKAIILIDSETAWDVFRAWNVRTLACRLKQILLVAKFSCSAVVEKVSNVREKTTLRK